MRTVLELVGVACVVTACFLVGWPLALFAVGLLLVVLANRAG